MDGVRGRLRRPLRITPRSYGGVLKVDCCTGNGYIVTAAGRECRGGVDNILLIQDFPTGKWWSILLGEACYRTKEALFICTVAAPATSGVRVSIGLRAALI